MSAADGWTWQPPRPPPPGRRYAPAWVLLGAATTIGIPLLGFPLGAYGDNGGGRVLTAIVQTGLWAPLLIGIVLVAVPGPPARRGMGLGMIIGWALSPIVFAGVCILFTDYRPRLAGTVTVLTMFRL